MRLSVEIDNRNFSTPVSLPNVTFSPERYGFRAMGGPDFAEIKAVGDRRALWSLLNWLRAPITIYDERDEPVWWGFVHGVTVRMGAIEVGVTLDNLFNRVAIAYTYISPGTNTAGTRATTDYAEDDDSIDEYGTKELLDSRDGCSTATAEARRDAILDRLRYPIPEIGNLGQGSERSAMLHCKGWWETLDWVHYAKDAGLESHTDGSATQDLGNHANRQKIAQSFQITGEGWDASSVAVKLSKVVAQGEDVDDNVVVELADYNAGEPGSVLASATLDGTELTTSATWQELGLSTSVALEVGVTYWVIVRRSGSVDSDNYYRVTVDEDLGYTDGVLRIYNGSTWSARTPDADMAFKVLGIEETTVQIETAVDDSAEFITGVEIEDESSVSVSQYRDGDTTLLYVVEQLLNDGTSDGRRLLARVTKDRVLQVYVEPETPDSDYDTDMFLRDDGHPEDKWGNTALTHTCPVALWCALKDVIAATMNTNVVANPSPFFIERSEYDVINQQWIPEARGASSPWEIGQAVPSI